jgi:hypothetical protein
MADPDLPTPEDQAAVASLARLIFGFMPAQMVHAAAALGLADLIGVGSRTPADLAEATGAHADSLRRLLRALTVLGLFAEAKPDRFALTPVGAALRADVAHSVRPLVMSLFDDTIWRSWGDLAYAIRTGRPALERTTGRPLFEYFAADGARSAAFNAAMSAGTRTDAALLVAEWDFSRYRTVIDVGGGNGALLATVLLAHPGLRGVVFDTPAGAKQAAATLAAAGVDQRGRIEVGDFFESVPAGGDAYLLKSVLHDWDDERCVTILRNCRLAMSVGDRVLAVEMVLPDRIGPDVDPFAVITDVNLMVLTTGRERSEADFRRLFHLAGFDVVAVSGPVGRHRVIEGAPRVP